MQAVPACTGTSEAGFDRRGEIAAQFMTVDVDAAATLFLVLVVLLAKQVACLQAQGQVGAPQGELLARNQIQAQARVEQRMEAEERAAAEAEARAVEESAEQGADGAEPDSAADELDDSAADGSARDDSAQDEGPEGEQRR